MVLTASYPKEAARGKALRPLLTELEADLKRFTLPGERSLYDVAEGFVVAAEELDTLLSRRADLRTEAAQRSAAAQLRTKTLRSITRLREAVDDELDTSPDLPRTLDGDLFGYLDVLIAAKATRKPTKPE